MIAHSTLRCREDTLHWGKAFGSLLESGDVVALIGDLGAGKTTLTQAIADGLAVSDPVSSPTFTLIQEYNGATPLFHFDPYRLDEPEEMERLGFYEYLERDGVVVVEWADKIAQLLPAERFEVRLEMVFSGVDAVAQTTGEVHDAPRRLTLTATGARQRQTVVRLAQLLPNLLTVMQEGSLDG